MPMPLNSESRYILRLFLLKLVIVVGRTPVNVLFVIFIEIFTRLKELCQG